MKGFFTGWRRRVSPEQHLAMLQASAAVVLAVESATGRVVGFAAAISDGVLFAHVTALEVLAPYRRRGLGRSMVQGLLARLEHLYAVDVVCEAELLTFYARCGLTPSTAAIRRRYLDPAAGRPGL